jgi:hypothetical protein
MKDQRVGEQRTIVATRPTGTSRCRIYRRDDGEYRAGTSRQMYLRSTEMNERRARHRPCLRISFDAFSGSVYQRHETYQRFGHFQEWMLNTTRQCDTFLSSDKIVDEPEEVDLQWHVARRRLRDIDRESPRTTAIICRDRRSQACHS